MLLKLVEAPLATLPTQSLKTTGSIFGASKYQALGLSIEAFKGIHMICQPQK